MARDIWNLHVRHVIQRSSQRGPGTRFAKETLAYLYVYLPNQSSFPTPQWPLKHQNAVDLIAIATFVVIKNFIKLDLMLSWEYWSFWRISMKNRRFWWGTSTRVHITRVQIPFSMPETVSVWRSVACADARIAQPHSFRKNPIQVFHWTRTWLATSPSSSQIFSLYML